MSLPDRATRNCSTCLEGQRQPNLPKTGVHSGTLALTPSEASRWELSGLLMENRPQKGLRRLVCGKRDGVGWAQAGRGSPGPFSLCFSLLRLPLVLQSWPDLFASSPFFLAGDQCLWGHGGLARQGTGISTYHRASQPHPGFHGLEQGLAL